MIRVTIPKQREWSEELYQKALEFHGHGGPFLVVGLRIGFLALEMLDAKGWFDVKCKVRLRWRPPDSCIIDGIQISTGCTMGKKNLEVYEDEGVSAEFTKHGKCVKIELKSDVLNDIKNMLSTENEKEVRGLIERLKTEDYDKIFKIYN
ncbi:MAG: FmdE family protein [Candidatus Bathyarchaeia archaeon]